MSSSAIHGVIGNGKDHGQTVRLNGLMNGSTYERNWVTTLGIMASLLWNVRLLYRHSSVVVSFSSVSCCTYCSHAFLIYLDSDFLQTWDLIERATIFDSSWMMSSHWLRMPPQPLLYPWTFGDIVCAYFVFCITIISFNDFLLFSQSTLPSAHRHLPLSSCPDLMNVLSVALITCPTGIWILWSAKEENWITQVHPMRMQGSTSAV